MSEEQVEKLEEKAQASLTLVDKGHDDLKREQEKFMASMVLAGCGDALGYYNGRFEFCNSGLQILQMVEKKGGLSKIKVEKFDWRLSDDTIMSIATANALVASWKTHEELWPILAQQYKDCMKDMNGRSPGMTCMGLTNKLRPDRPDGLKIPFNPYGGGCGAAMRSAPIGLLYHRPDQINDLVAVSIESGRMTHNHPTGYLGALASALFVSYALQQKPLVEWGVGLLATLEIARKYIEDTGRDVEENEANWSYFEQKWEEYVKLRGIKDGKSQPIFPEVFGARQRDEFYKEISFSGWGGASGHDAPMIAYDALLGCGDSWEELCKRGMFHGGDSDSTGIIAGACWGAMKGFDGVPECNYKGLEYRDRLVKLAENIWKKSEELKTQ